MRAPETIAKPIIAAARAAGRKSLGEADGKALLAAYGISVPRSAVVSDEDDVSNVSDLTPPLAVKIMSPEILHKSDVGGVALGLQGLDDVRRAIAGMAQRPPIREAVIDGYLVEEMVARGQELVIGSVLDPQFGPLIMIGLGGVFVEILADVSFRICPIAERDARQMLFELKGQSLLKGARGGAGVSVDAIVDCLLKIGGEGGLLMDFGGEFAEIDINPLIVGESGAVAVDARFLLVDRSDTSAEEVGQSSFADLPVLERLTPFFAPETVAVVGASTRSTTIANTFIRRMKAFGYKGEIYPIHPKAQEVEGLVASPSLAETPRPIDYAYVAIGAPRIPDLLGAAKGNVKFAQIISSGFGEITEGQALERELVRQARAAGCRVVGPNCLGLYSPRGRVTFPVDAPTALGSVGVISQSGGLGTDIIKRGQWKGITFSGLVTVGNSADLGPSDFLEFFLEDPQTKVIGLYLEDVKDGRLFFEMLRAARAVKPVVLLNGGRSRLGRAAAQSHTGALSSDDSSWSALARQTGCLRVRTVDEFINVLLALQYLVLRPGRPTRNVALFGNGGGTSVLAVDNFADLDLDVRPFDAETRGKLEAMALPPGTSVANPIDAPVGTLQKKNGEVANEILNIVYRSARPDAVIMHLNLAAFVGRGDTDPVENLLTAAVNVRRKFPDEAHFLLVLRVDGSKELDDLRRTYRRRALEAGIPVYNELADAAQVLAAMRDLEQYRSRIA